MTRHVFHAWCVIVFAGAFVFGGARQANADPSCDSLPDGAVERACKPIFEHRLEVAKQDEAKAVAAAEAARKRHAALPGTATQAEINAAIKDVDDTRKAELAATETRKAVQALVDQLAAAVNLAEQAYRQNHCERELVICYDRDGKLFAGAKTGDHLPAALRPGDKVTVVVLTPIATDNNTSISVTFAARASLEHPFPDSKTAAAAMPVQPAAFVALPFPSESVPDDAVDFTISFQRVVKDGAGVETTEVIPIELGYSYFSVALLVAATYKADRHVLRDLGTTSDHAVDPGLALNIFPGGRQRGVIGYLRHCGLGTWAHAGRCLANNVGFQIATDLDLTNPTDKLYAGVVFEPVAGLALVGGVSLRKVDVVPPAGALPALEAMATSPSETRYVARGYVGVTITLDLLDTISSVGGSIRKVKEP